MEFMLCFKKFKVEKLFYWSTCCFENVCAVRRCIILTNVWYCEFESGYFLTIKRSNFDEFSYDNSPQTMFVAVYLFLCKHQTSCQLTSIWKSEAENIISNFICPKALPRRYIAIMSMWTFFFNRAETLFLNILDLWE